MRYTTHQKNPKSAPKWIIISSLTYKERLIKLKTLSLSFYSELHSLLILCDLINNFFLAKYIDFNSNNWSREGVKCEIKLAKKRLSKSDQNFWPRTAFFIILSTNTQTLQPKKQCISDIYWKLFHKSSKEIDMCT